MAGHVSGRAGLLETGAVFGTESVATTIFRSQSKREERSRHKRCAFVGRQRISKTSLNGKLTRPFEER